MRYGVFSTTMGNTLVVYTIENAELVAWFEHYYYTYKTDNFSFTLDDYKKLFDIRQAFDSCADEGKTSDYFS